MKETFDVEITWHGFQLHPEIPPGGLSLEALFGQRAQKLRNRVQAFAEQMGVELEPPTHAPSTIAPLAATEWARDQGALEPMRDHLMDAYWRRGLDIEDPGVLADAGSAVGLDPAETATAAVEPTYIDRVADARRDAHDANVTAIPTLLVRGFPIVGCQNWDTYDKVFTKLEIKRR